MKRIVGNCCAFLGLFFMCGLSAEIELSLADENGAQLENPGIGRPFLLIVDFKNFTGPQREPVIQELNRYDHYRTGVQMSTVNGTSSATYTYRCRIDSGGLHTLGPVTIPGTQEKSGQLSFQVLEQPKYLHHQKKEDGSVLFRIAVEPASAVVGQKVVISAKFYTTDSRMKLQNIIMPNFNAFSVVDKIGPTYGKEKLNGTNYEYTEWRIELYATQQGNHLIPAFCADYEYPSASHFSGFMWSHFAQTKRVYSNSSRVSVESVPVGAKTPDFIGKNVSVQVSANPLQAKIGEGIILTLSFAGEGDLELLKTPLLKKMPEGIKYYDSKTSMIGGTPDQLPKKQFEYVLQGKKEGLWEIPAQHFEIFDVDTRAYKTVSTKPFMITILPGLHAASEAPSFEKKNDLDAVVELDDCSIRPLHESDPWYPTPERAPINWGLFFMLIIAPCGYGLMSYVRNVLKRPLSRKKRAKKAADNAREALERARKNQNFTIVYHVFNTYFAQVWEIAPGYITAELIEQKMREEGLSDAFIREWNDFYSRMSASTFGSNASIPDIQIGADAIAWIGKLKEIL